MTVISHGRFLMPRIDVNEAVQAARDRARVPHASADSGRAHADAVASDSRYMTESATHVACECRVWGLARLPSPAPLARPLPLAGEANALLYLRFET
jgi:hypothetical protein